ncbi:MAG TPA: FAD-binding protein [Polyangiaceae bacterium]|jgi:alkyldihydroxyacetonephosphate synthase
MIRLDRESLLVHVDAGARFGEVEAYLAERGLTLDVADAFEGTVGAWLESGAPGARSAWLDPADHLVAGFSARIRATDASFEIRPAPRRATGPDLTALVLGLRGRMLALDAVWLRVHRAASPRPTSEKFTSDEAEPLGEHERALFDAIADALK